MLQLWMLLKNSNVDIKVQCELHTYYSVSRSVSGRLSLSVITAMPDCSLVIILVTLQRMLHLFPNSPFLISHSGRFRPPYSKHQSTDEEFKSSMINFHYSCVPLLFRVLIRESILSSYLSSMIFISTEYTNLVDVIIIQTTTRKLPNCLFHLNSISKNYSAVGM